MWSRSFLLCDGHGGVPCGGGAIADGPEGNHSTLYRTEVKKEWSYVSLPYTPPWSGRGNITFYYCSVILETNGTYVVGGACYM